MKPKKNSGLKTLVKPSSASERAQSLFMSIEISDICMYICAGRTYVKSFMRMLKNSLLGNDSTFIK